MTDTMSASSQSKRDIWWRGAQYCMTEADAMDDRQDWADVELSLMQDR